MSSYIQFIRIKKRKQIQFQLILDFRFKIKFYLFTSKPALLMRVTQIASPEATDRNQFTKPLGLIIDLKANRD